MPANGFRILIADDHELVRGGLRSLIESHEGWEVCGEAEDGDGAVPKAAALNPDAIILDLAMPRMDDLEAASHILKASPSVPIILHTLYPSAQVDFAAQGMGIHKVTRKTNTVDLFAELESLFRDRDTAKALSTRPKDIE
jgi:DNA-binding NarL/FixJ family response regulator